MNFYENTLMIKNRRKSSKTLNVENSFNNVLTFQVVKKTRKGVRLNPR